VTSHARYRADELAAELGISVQVLRSYQSKGLLPPPRHEGRVAWYGPHHRERVHRILQLKERGYSLRMIAEALDDGAGPSGGAGRGRGDRGRARVPLGPPGLRSDEHAVLRLTDVAERSGVPVEVLRALAASRLLRPHHLSGGDLYSEADVRFVRQVLELLGVGLSLEDLLRIAKPLLAASDELADDVMVAWEELVGSRLRRPERPDRPERPERGERPEDDASAQALAERVAESVRILAAIVGQLVAYHVERAVLDAAQADLADRGTVAEREALSRALTDREG
jgi:DNA-binding transcriptional MerR regulator